MMDFTIIQLRQPGCVENDVSSSLSLEFFENSPLKDADARIDTNVSFFRVEIHRHYDTNSA